MHFNLIFYCVIWHVTNYNLAQVILILIAFLITDFNYIYTFFEKNVFWKSKNALSKRTSKSQLFFNVSNSLCIFSLAI